MSGSISVTVAEVSPRITAEEIAIDEIDVSLRDLVTSGDIVVSDPPLTSAPVDAHAHAPDPLIGALVADRYRVVELLGRGGMGAVYKVEHARIGKLLAMKLLARELADRPDAARRFKREALTVSKLQSPNTVSVFDFGVWAGLTYFVMELASGTDLGRVLRAEGPMPFTRMARIVVQVCSSLAEAHGLGIVHRDIKPENIMLVPTGRGGDLAKVLDFGLAKLRDRAGLDDVTCRGMILGTPSYMAPEQIRGEEIDARADVYAVGALMYRMITGQPVFVADSPLAVLTKHLHEAPMPPIDRAPDRAIPRTVSRVVMRALRKDPRERYPRIEDLQSALVDELRAAGTTSVDALLDPSRMRAIEIADAEDRATRFDVDAYERDLRRTRYGAWLAVLALASGAAATTIDLLATKGARSDGVEIEPNNTAMEATPIALGREARGQLGKRLDATHGDRDFYSFVIPEGASRGDALIQLHVSAVPSMATCTTMYRAGFGDPLGTYCVGSPGRDLTISLLALDAGRYHVAVAEDVGASGLVHESISDTYTIIVDRAATDSSMETEPNDQVASATRMAMSRPRTAVIGWVRDEDFCCAPRGATSALQWRVRAALSDVMAFEATLFEGERESAPSKIEFEAGATWESRTVIADGISSRCLRVRLASDPALRARGVGERYVVEVSPVL